MIFDECTPYPASETDARESMLLSLRWAMHGVGSASMNSGTMTRTAARRCSALSRVASTTDLQCRSHLPGCCQIGFDGYAIGGLAVGEPEDATPWRFSTG